MTEYLKPLSDTEEYVQQDSNKRPRFGRKKEKKVRVNRKLLNLKLQMNSCRNRPVRSADPGQEGGPHLERRQREVQRHLQQHRPPQRVHRGVQLAQHRHERLERAAGQNQAQAVPQQTDGAAGREVRPLAQPPAQRPRPAQAVHQPSH